MIMLETIENWALHAFADGELDVEDSKAIERLLAENAEARKALATINYQKTELHKAYDDVLNEVVPAHLMAAAQARSPRRMVPYLAMAASVAFLLIGGALGWFAAHTGNAVQIADLASRALVAHETYSVEVRHPVEVAASEQDHLQAWLSKRVGSEFKIPDLQKDGYTLLGGRLLAENDAPAGQLMYETADKQRMTIYFSANEAGNVTGMKLEQKDKLITCYWRDAKLALAVTADMPREAMVVLGSSIFAQIEGRHGTYER